ncbi:MAG: prolyl oligopeptidase family serine peptidase [Candidatus Aminicenantes bacterium]|nr:prolyl oligopeptidase family serine peptidase [Candidatus Aminicenantes bacterium]
MRKIIAKSIVTSFLLFSVSLGTTPGAEKNYKLLDKETYMEMESIGSPNISPNGTHILFTRAWVDKTSDRFRSNLWIVDIEGKRVRELTHGNWRDFSPVWSPDGKKIAFLSDRDETTQIHVMWLDTREVAQLTHLDRSPGSLRWSPDGKKLAFTLFIPDDKPILPVKLPKKPEGAKWAKPAVIVDRLSWRRDGRGPTPKGNTHIFILDAELGGTPKKVTSGDYSHSDPQWSQDGKNIYFSAIRKPDAEYLRGDSEIYSVDLSTLKIKALTDRKGPDRGPRISPDGKWIAYTGYDDKNYTSHLSNLYLMDIQGNKKSILAGTLPNSPSSITWAPDGSGIYYLMREKGNSNLYFVSTNRKIRKITEGVHYLSGLSIAKNGQVATTRSTFYKHVYLVTFSLRKPGDIKKLVDVNEDVLANVKLGEVIELWFKSPDGLDLQGWLIQPAEFEQNKQYPMILYIHGGPWSMYSVRFSWAWQNFAANGYAVLYMNPRGSTGYGQDFVNGIQFSYPGKDYDDLMAGVDAALNKGFIDENNLFVCGGSGGGVLTAWIVGHTDRFRAAVSMRPVINWHSFVGTTDGSGWYRQFEKYPWEDPTEYAVRSPLHYVGNVKTPTMVMTGEADLRTPMGQSEEYYRALKMLKKETLLIRMPDEYHGWRRPSHRLLQQLYLIAWFEKYRIKPEPVTK